MSFRWWIVAAMIVAGVRPAAADAILSPAEHPNHYILVVDASYSTIETASRKLAYRRVLEERVPDLLFSGGLGAIPPAVPGRDVFTVVTFGIVTSNYDYRVAYEHLNEFSFQRHFIHLVVVRRPLTREQVVASMWPREFYRLTVLQWARGAALASLPPAADADEANRTFRIVITDDEPNEGGVHLEKQLAKAHNNDAGAAQGWMDQATAEMHATDGASKEGESADQVITEKIGNDKETYYITAQELIPRSRDPLHGEAAHIVPLESIRCDYIDETPSSLRIAATPSRALRQWVERHGGSLSKATWRVAGTDTAGEALGQPLKVPLSTAHDYCAPFVVSVSVTGNIQHRDSRLGRTVLTYQFAQQLTAPAAPTCAATRMRRLVRWTIISLLAIAFIAYVLYQRLIGSRPVVLVPGIVTPFRLSRGTPDAQPIHRPQSGDPLFTLVLPPRWKQDLFCRGMKIRISGNLASAVQWPGTAGELRLPAEKDLITALLARRSSDPSTLTITLSGLAATAAVTIHYPKP